MQNLNNTVKKKQLYLLIGIVIGLLLFCLAIYIYIVQTNDKKKPQKKEAPVFVGVINQTFDEKYTNSVLKDNQSAAREVDRKYDSVVSRLNQSNKELESLKNQLKQQQDLNRQQNSFFNETLSKLEKKIGNGKSYNIDISDNISSKQGGNSNVKGQNNLSSYDYTIPKTLTSTSLNESLTTKKSDLPYIPSGSFVEATIIEGADTNASVTGNNNTDPMQFRLIGKVQMPNDEEFDLSGCFVTAEVYGDISSERGKVRTHSISCKLNNKTIDMKIQGHVAFMGKNGIKGIPIMRNGQIIAWAGAAGLLEGLGKGAESAAGKTVGVGATSSVGAGDVLQSALGGGASTAAKTLSDYYIKRAEQYHPIIEIGAGNQVTVMFQNGFQLKYIEDDVKKPKNQDALYRDGRGEPTYYASQYYQNNVAPVTSSSSKPLLDKEKSDGNVVDEKESDENKNDENKKSLLDSIKLEDFIK